MPPKRGKVQVPQSRPRPPWRFLASWLRDNTASLRFLATTALSLAVAFWILHKPWVVEHLVGPYTTFVASVSRLSLRLVGVDAGGSAHTITSPEFTVSIMNVCNGLEVTAIFLATVLGFPATARSKLVGIVIGYPVIFLVNIVRIVALFVLGIKAPDIFHAAHYYYAQALVIIATVCAWMAWVTLCTPHGNKIRHRLSG